MPILIFSPVYLFLRHPLYVLKPRISNWNTRTILTVGQNNFNKKIPSILIMGITDNSGLYLINLFIFYVIEKSRIKQPKNRSCSWKQKRPMSNSISKIISGKVIHPKYYNLPNNYCTIFTVNIYIYVQNCRGSGEYRCNSYYW